MDDVSIKCRKCNKITQFKEIGDSNFFDKICTCSNIHITNNESNIPAYGIYLDNEIVAFSTSKTKALEITQGDRKYELRKGYIAEGRFIEAETTKDAHNIKKR